MAVHRHRSTLTSRAGRRPGHHAEQSDQVVILPFQRLTESERLARDLRALVEAGLIVAVSDGDETRYTAAEPGDG